MNWFVVFIIPQGTTKPQPKFIEAVLSASKSAPNLLSWHEKTDPVDSIIATVSPSKKKPSTIFDLILPDGMLYILSNTHDGMQITNDLHSKIQCWDNMNNDGYLIFLNYMRVFNNRGNEESIRKFETFWKAAARVIELDGGFGEHRRQHCSWNFDTTINI